MLAPAARVPPAGPARAHSCGRLGPLLETCRACVCLTPLRAACHSSASYPGLRQALPHLSLPGLRTQDEQARGPPVWQWSARGQLGHNIRTCKGVVCDPYSPNVMGCWGCTPSH